MKVKHLFILAIGFYFASNHELKAQNSHTDNQSINSLIKKKREYNKKYGTGFIIQLYNGSEGKAKSILNSFKTKYYWITPKLKYEAPDWKVQVGNYKTRLDADIALNKFKEDFSGGIIIKK